MPLVYTPGLYPWFIPLVYTRPLSLGDWLLVCSLGDLIYVAVIVRMFIFQLISFLIVSTQFDFYLVIVSVIKITVVGKLSTFVDELQRPEELLGDNGSAIKLGSMMARWAKLNLYGR